jgi:thymidylate synthase
MSRIFKDHLEAGNELRRTLKEMGITVPITHMQDKFVKGNKDFYTRELIGYSYKVSNASSKLVEMIKYFYPKEYQPIIDYCELELQDRLSGESRNPGIAHKSRYSLWEQFLEKEKKFSYTYSERISDPVLKQNQISKVIDELKTSPDSRQCIVQIFNYAKDHENIGGKRRIPCSMHYQYLLRNKKLHSIYVMRSNDLLVHFVVDIYLACKTQEHIAKELGVEVGSFTYFGGSLHCYMKDIPDSVF